MNIGWRTKYILALSEDFLIHRWKLSGTMGLAHGFHFHNNVRAEHFGAPPQVFLQILMYFLVIILVSDCIDKIISNLLDIK